MYRNHIQRLPGDTHSIIPLSSPLPRQTRFFSRCPMTTTQQAFLAILRASLHQEEATPALTADQWPELFRLAESHKVLPMIFEAVFPQVRQADPALAMSAKAQVRNRVILQTMRTAEFLELFQALTDAGASPLVVKGIVCRQLYPKPDHRPSSDEDILIPPEEFALCHSVMTRLGLRTTEADPDKVYEVPYRRPNSPLYIELHKHLFPPESGAYGDLNRFFADAAQRTVELTVQGHRIRTLGHTDHLLYLLLHAYKHFLHSGFGIRQICDILLFSHAHAGQIEWGHIRKCCKAVRADKFAAAVFTIGVRHLGFGPVGPWTNVDELPLLEDVLSAGVYGSADDDRLHSSTITLEAVSAQKQGRGTHSGLLTAAFPSAQALEGRYPWLKGRHWLLPAAWGDRIFSYLRENRSPGSGSAALKLGAERRALLKYYGILK